MSRNVSKFTALKTQRIAAGYSVGDLAKRAGVSDWAVTNTEAGGTLRHPEAQRLADALGVSFATLGQVEL